MQNLFSVFTDFIGWFFLFAVAFLILFILTALFAVAFKIICGWLARNF